MKRKTRADKLIEAAEPFGAKEFTPADLTVVAWLADKMAFGLRGFEKVFPDSKIVAVELSRRGGRFARLVVKVRPGVYRYTPAQSATG